MGEMKPTPGPWSVDDAQPGDAFRYVIHGDGDSFGGICRISTNGNANAESDARLIAEAGTVFHNTGLSPVQLVEQRDELMAACKKLVEWEAREKDHAIGFMERINLCEAAFQMMYAALAKCEGVK